MKWFNQIIVKIMPIFPKSFVWLFSQKYIAGTSLDDGVQKTKDLNNIGCTTTMDVLGEEILTKEEAKEEKEECIRVLDATHEHKLDSYLSLKPTSLGLRIDKEQCYENIKEIVQHAKKLNNFVAIDMEDSTCTDDTLEIYRRLRKEFDNVGTVIQAYLKRSKDDVQGLIDDGIANLRLCKGIYDEPKDIAYKDKEKVRQNFVELIEMMLKSKSFVAIATHDRPVVDASYKLIKELKADKSNYEFQMLLGVTEKMRGEIVGKGDKMRIYVPYGEHWYGYSMRRLKENPSVAGHIVKNIFIRG